MLLYIITTFMLICGAWYGYLAYLSYTWAALVFLFWSGLSGLCALVVAFFVWGIRQEVRVIEAE